MKKTFTQTKIVGNARFFGLGYCILSKDSILIQGEQRKVTCTINRSNDSVLVEGKTFYQIYLCGDKFFNFMAELARDGE